MTTTTTTMTTTTATTTSNPTMPFSHHRSSRTLRVGSSFTGSVLRPMLQASGSRVCTAAALLPPGAACWLWESKPMRRAVLVEHCCSRPVDETVLAHSGTFWQVGKEGPVSSHLARCSLLVRSVPLPLPPLSFFVISRTLQAELLLMYAWPLKTAMSSLSEVT